MLKKSFWDSILFKIILIVLLFLPSYTQIAYDPSKTTEVVASVLSNPLVYSIKWILPIAKVLLLVIAILPFIYSKYIQKYILGYYSFILIIIGLFQNMANTQAYGFTWLIGNTLIQYVVLVFCLVDLFKNKSKIHKNNLIKSRIWVLIPMLLAILMPYSVNVGNIIKPSFTLAVLLNESGLTYCMITPVIIGIFLLFSKEIYKPTFSIISYVGLLFGILNMFTWFGFQVHNWWMGVLHLPLLILSFYGLIVVHKNKEKPKMDLK